MDLALFAMTALTFTSNTTYIPSSDAVLFQVTVVAAGGGGGICNYRIASGGGGSGETLTGWFTRAQLPAEIPLIIGQGGHPGNPGTATHTLAITSPSIGPRSAPVKMAKTASLSVTPTAAHVAAAHAGGGTPNPITTIPHTRTRMNVHGTHALKSSNASQAL